jgi:hypothetical protein
MGILIFTNCNGDFFSDFNENMSALGLPAPKQLFGTPLATLGALNTVIGVLDKLGLNTTVSEVFIEAGAAGVLRTVAGMAASGYVGAVLGSALIASQGAIERKNGQCKVAPFWARLSYAQKVAVAVDFAKKNHVFKPWLVDVWMKNPRYISGVA